MSVGWSGLWFPRACKLRGNLVDRGWRGHLVGVGPAAWLRWWMKAPGRPPEKKKEKLRKKQEMDRVEQRPFGAAGRLGDRAGYLVGAGPGTRIRRLEDHRIEQSSGPTGLLGG